MLRNRVAKEFDAFSHVTLRITSGATSASAARAFDCVSGQVESAWG